MIKTQGVTDLDPSTAVRVNGFIATVLRLQDEAQGRVIDVPFEVITKEKDHEVPSHRKSMLHNVR